MALSSGKPSISITSTSRSVGRQPSARGDSNWSNSVCSPATSPPSKSRQALKLERSSLKTLKPRSSGVSRSRGSLLIVSVCMRWMTRRMRSFPMSAIVVRPACCAGESEGVGSGSCTMMKRPFAFRLHDCCTRTACAVVQEPAKKSSTISSPERIWSSSLRDESSRLWEIKNIGCQKSSRISDCLVEV